MIESTAAVAVHEAEKSEGIWSGSYRFLTLGLVLMVAAAAFESLSVATTMPAALGDLGGLPLYGWAFSAFMLTTLIGLAISGSEADRLGPKRPFLVGVGLFAAGLVLAGFAPSMPVLIAARALQGFGAGLVSSIAYVMIGRGYPEAARPRMLALISSAYVLPSLVGPALAGLIADHVGWRWVFLGLAPLLPLAAGLALPAMRRFGEPSRAPRDWAWITAAMRLAVGTALIMAGLGNRQQIFLSIALAGIGALLVVPAFLRLQPAGTQHRAGLFAALLAATLLNMAFFGVDAFVPLSLTTARGQTATFAGLALTAATIGWTAGAWLQARLAAQHSRRAMVTLGLGLISVGILGVVAALQPHLPVVLALPAWGIAGLGMGLASPTLSLLALEYAPVGQEGASTSAMQLAGVLGIAIGAGVGGVIVGGAESAAQVSLPSILGQNLLMIGVACVAILIARRLPRRAQTPPNPDSPAAQGT